MGHYEWKNIGEAEGEKNPSRLHVCDDDDNKVKCAENCWLYEELSY